MLFATTTNHSKRGDALIAILAMETFNIAQTIARVKGALAKGK